MPKKPGKGHQVYYHDLAEHRERERNILLKHIMGLFRYHRKQHPKHQGIGKEGILNLFRHGYYLKLLYLLFLWRFRLEIIQHIIPNLVKRKF